MPAGRPAVDVSEFPSSSMNVKDIDDLGWGIHRMVKWGKDRLGAESRHGEAAPVIRVAGSKHLRKGRSSRPFVRRRMRRGGNRGGSIWGAGIERDLSVNLVALEVSKERDAGDGAAEKGREAGKG